MCIDVINMGKAHTQNTAINLMQLLSLKRIKGIKRERGKERMREKGRKGPWV